MPIETVSLFEPISAVLGLIAQVAFAILGSAFFFALAFKAIVGRWSLIVVLTTMVLAVGLALVATVGMLYSEYSAFWYLPLIGSSALGLKFVADGSRRANG